MKLILIRHGETNECAQKIMKGRLDVSLSKQGIKQAKILGEKLKDEKIDFIYSSPLKRTIETAKEVAKFHTHTQIKISKDLIDCGLGLMEGKTKAELGIKKGERPPKHLVDSCEGFESIFNRIDKFIKKIKKEHNKEDLIVIVAHGCITKAFNAVIEKKKPIDIAFMKPRKHTEINIYEI